MFYKYVWTINFYLELGVAQWILASFAFQMFVLAPDINIRTPSPSFIPFLDKTVEKMYHLYYQ